MALIVDDILLGPCKLVHWIGKKLYENAEEELTDESFIRRRLLEVQMQFELDELTEEEYRTREDNLMAQLNAIRKYKEGQQIG